MALTLYAHPFSSYSQKVLIALYESGTPFEFRVLGPDDPAAGAELEALWPLKRFPVLVDGGRTLRESSIIIEYLSLHYPGATQLLPKDPDAALETRMMDRFFDNYIMAPMQEVVFDRLKADERRDPVGVDEAKARLDVAYGWLERIMDKRSWAAGESFSLADCAAAPSLFYADWTHPIGARFPRVGAYRARLLAQPSVARAVDGGRPYRHLFPLGAPDRD